MFGMTTIKGLLRHPVSLFFVCLILCFVAVDAVILFFNLDIASVKKTIYTVEGESGYTGGKELYRDSADTELLYELVPNACATLPSSLRHQKDIDKSEIGLSIDRFGFRSNGGRERTKDKPDGVFRIIALGGSNTFGFSVSDSQTWPAQLERVLNEKTPGRFEVWNAGLSAYNMIQKVEYAEKIVKEYSPDLLLFQHYNSGRRAFFCRARYEYFFRRNRDLWCENVPLPFYCSDFIGRLHRMLVRHWALYRLCVAEYNCSVLPENMRQDTANRQNYYPLFADNLAQKRFAEFLSVYRKNKNLKIGVIVNKNLIGCGSVAGLPVYFIHDAADNGKDRIALLDIHPPSQIYGLYAQKIAAWLIDEGLVPDKRAEHED